MPTIASLGLYLVTDAIKRRQLGDRVKRQFSPEILQIYCADSLFILESETKSCVYGESDFDSTGAIGQPCRTMILYQLGRAYNLHISRKTIMYK